MMDYGQENMYSGGGVVQVLSGNSGNDIAENWGNGPVDPAVWATEEDYRLWGRESSVDASFNSSYDGRQSSNEQANKRSRNSHSGSKLIGKMFYKTKLCCKFRMGTCPYITNCNFAHSNEELRKPPPNWQEIVAAHEDDRVGFDEPREEFQIPILGVSEDTQRSYKGRHCKKFYTEEGCPYGDSCTFLHDEQSKARESVVISLGPGSGGGGGCSGGGGGGYGNNGNVSNLKPSNWKTRICNKWELTGYCPFGSKCHFAHGVEELHSYGGGPVETEARDSSAHDQKQGVAPSKTSTDTIVPSVTSVPHSDHHHAGVPTQRLSNVMQKTEKRPHQKWKGPDKINKIYGDWIDDFE